jgi:penicillin-binding protein 1A
LIGLNKSIAYKDWRVGIVLRRGGNGQIGFTDGSTAALTGLVDQVRVGDVITAAPAGTGVYALRILPGVGGGMLVEQPGSGRVLAVAGGFDDGLDSFNRATQAQRQPGSTIKPFVYATGLDNGMTPASMVPDQSFCVYQGANLGEKCFRNFDSRGWAAFTRCAGALNNRAT